MNTQTIAMRYIALMVIAIMAFGVGILPALANHGGAEDETVSHSETAEHDDNDDQDDDMDEDHHDDSAADDHDHDEDTHSENHVMNGASSLSSDQVKTLVALLTQLIKLLEQQKSLLPS